MAQPTAVSMKAVPFDSQKAEAHLRAAEAIIEKIKALKPDLDVGFELISLRVKISNLIATLSKPQDPEVAGELKAQLDRTFGRLREIFKREQTRKSTPLVIAGKPEKKEKTCEMEGLIFSTGDFKKISSVANPTEGWKVRFNEDGSFSVQTKGGSALIREGKVEGILQEEVARDVAETAVLMRVTFGRQALKQLQKEAKGTNIF